jgi:hypothetical protein
MTDVTNTFTIGSLLSFSSRCFTQLSASFWCATFVERTFHRADETNVFFGFLEAVAAMTGFLLGTILLAEFLNPFIDGVSDPSVFVLLLPILLPQSILKCRAVHSEVKQMMNDPLW